MTNNDEDTDRGRLAHPLSAKLNWHSGSNGAENSLTFEAWENRKRGIESTSHFNGMMAGFTDVLGHPGRGGSAARCTFIGNSVLCGRTALDLAAQDFVPANNSETLTLHVN